MQLEGIFYLEYLELACTNAVPLLLQLFLTNGEILFYETDPYVLVCTGGEA
jgi:hypothetical protein